MVVEANQPNDRDEGPLSSSRGPGDHPGAFAVKSLKSRAAARAMLERRPKPEIVFSLGDSPRPRFV
jgi:hypothetical protein